MRHACTPCSPARAPGTCGKVFSAPGWDDACVFMKSMNTCMCMPEGTRAKMCHTLPARPFKSGTRTTTTMLPVACVLRVVYTPLNH